MPNELSLHGASSHKAHRPLKPANAAARRALFFNSDDAFNRVLQPVPDRVFQAEPEKALAAGTPTGLIVCDSQLGRDDVGPATSPFMLARYARINDGDTLEAEFNTVGSIWYVIQGSGVTEIAGQSILWNPGDVFLLPGGAAATLKASGADAVLWVVTNEPQMKFENVRPLEPANSGIEVVFYPAAEIDRQIERVYELARKAETAGLAVMFSSQKQRTGRSIIPISTLAMNTLPPGDMQRAHRHNSVAVTLVVQGENCYSMVDGNRKDWTPWATTVTPPQSLHSHHNEGSRQARFLIVQDGGLYSYGRTMGFSFA